MISFLSSSFVILLFVLFVEGLVFLLFYIFDINVVNMNTCVTGLLRYLLIFLRRFKFVPGIYTKKKPKPFVKN